MSLMAVYIWRATSTHENELQKSDRHEKTGEHVECHSVPGPDHNTKLRIVLRQGDARCTNLFKITASCTHHDLPVALRSGELAMAQLSNDASPRALKTVQGMARSSSN